MFKIQLRMAHENASLKMKDSYFSIGHWQN